MPTDWHRNTNMLHTLVYCRNTNFVSAGTTMPLLDHATILKASTSPAVRRDFAQVPENLAAISGQNWITVTNCSLILRSLGTNDSNVSRRNYSLKWTSWFHYQLTSFWQTKRHSISIDRPIPRYATLLMKTISNWLQVCRYWGVQRYNHTHPFNGPLSRTTRVSRYQKGKPIWILLKQETVSGSGISCAACKSAPRSRQTTMPAPHHSVFYRPDALPVAQPTASKHWRQCKGTTNTINSGRYKEQSASS